MVRDRFGSKGQAYCPVDERTFEGLPSLEAAGDCLRDPRPDAT